METIKTKRKRKSVFNEQTEPTMYLKRHQKLHMVRFNAAFNEAFGFVGEPMKCQFFEDDGRIFMRADEKGPNTIRNSSAESVSGFNSKGVFHSVSSKVKKAQGLTSYKMIQTQYKGYDCWEILA